MPAACAVQGSPRRSRSTRAAWSTAPGGGTSAMYSRGEGHTQGSRFSRSIGLTAPGGEATGLGPLLPVGINWAVKQARLGRARSRAGGGPSQRRGESSAAATGVEAANHRSWGSSPLHAPTRPPAALVKTSAPFSPLALHQHMALQALELPFCPVPVLPPLLPPPPPRAAAPDRGPRACAACTPT